MNRVYVAGMYSADNVIDVLENMRRGMQIGAEVLLAGFAPFVPWFDYHFTLMRPEHSIITVDDYYRYSMAWLEVSDCVLVISGEGVSKGVNAELERAKSLGIPVFRKLEEVVQYFEEVVPQSSSTTASIPSTRVDDPPFDRNRFLDPFDAIRKEHWEIREEGKDDMHPAVWYCRKHNEEFIIIEDYCPECKREVDGEHSLDDVFEVDEDFDEDFAAALKSVETKMLKKADE